MRYRIALFTLVLLSLTSLPAFAQRDWGRPRRPDSGACFFRDVHFRGDYFCMKAGERWESLPPGFGDSISSIRVFGGSRVRVFNDSSFRGPTLMIDGDVPNLRRVRMAEDPRRNWGDRISSIAVFRDRDDWGPPGRRRGWDDRH